MIQFIDPVNIFNLSWLADITPSYITTIKEL